MSTTVSYRRRLRKKNSILCPGIVDHYNPPLLCLAYAFSQFSDLVAAVYNFSPCRAGEHARNFLQDCKDKLVCDDFFLGGGRRKLFELHTTNKSQLAVQLLYEIEIKYVKISLNQSARFNGHDPYAYLKDVFIRLPMQRASEVDQLLPHKWQPV
ncbi:hypothetical protein C5U62_32855 [Pseudomonas protegens]|uniref:Transposase IS66 C-terminal domain-containing protein n=1 Tax=Pseudomonas protegens TaxID=380021 RepID=A0A2T6GAT7_9PSED|nr:hypothetical protein C5U62_32855 [Pseudomonas protegens]